MKKNLDLEGMPMKTFRIKLRGTIDVNGRDRTEALAVLDSLHIGDVPYCEVEWCRELEPNETTDFGSRE